MLTRTQRDGLGRLVVGFAAIALVISGTSIAFPAKGQGVRVRQNYLDLTKVERDLLVEGFFAMKNDTSDTKAPNTCEQPVANYGNACTMNSNCDSTPGSGDGLCLGCGWENRYDKFVCWHNECGCAGPESQHGRPSILPWHRELLRRFEDELRALPSPTCGSCSPYQDVTIPYWVWSEPFPSHVDDATSDGMFMGTETTGPFFNVAAWKTSPPAGSDALEPRKKAAAVDPFNPVTGVTLTEVAELLERTVYDAVIAPGADPDDDCITGNESACWLHRGFGNEGLGFRPHDEKLHDFMHDWVGGDLLNPKFAADDPAFWLTHAYFDCLWAAWQDLHPTTKHYLPDLTSVPASPDGDDLDDPMSPWNDKTIKDVLKTTDLNYTYASHLPDFGDAPDPFIATAGDYPSKKANNGAEHFDFNLEWLGDDVDGEADADVERDGMDTDGDGIDGDDFDDGVSFLGAIMAGVPVPIEVTVSVHEKSIKDGGASRYDETNAMKRLYLNAWADWNADGVWDNTECVEGPPRTFDCTGGKERIIGFGPGKFAIDPRMDGEFAAGNSGVYGFTIIPPNPVELDFYWRFRLDYGEDVGEIQMVDPDLNQEKGPAQFGEVEDYAIEVDEFDDSQVTCDVRVPAGSPIPNLVTLNGPTRVNVNLGGLGDSDSDGLEEVPTEMVQLDLTGFHPALGNMIIRLDPTTPTTGAIEETQNVNSGVLDIPPFTTSPAGLTADSFFDVSIEVELPDLMPGVTLRSVVTKEMSASISSKPPTSGRYCTDPEPVGLAVTGSGSVLAALLSCCHIPETEHPLAVELVSFEASLEEGAVEVSWETASEIDNEGFRVYRSLDPNTGFAVINGFIPAEGGPSFGASYAVGDDTVDPGTTYYYRLEDIDTSGVSAFHGASACSFSSDPTCEPLEVSVPAGEVSAGEFCAEHDIRQRRGRPRARDARACRLADWNDNEDRHPRDCRVRRDRDARTWSCVARRRAD